MDFGRRLAEKVAERESQILVGLDPDPAALWPGSWERVRADGRPVDRAASAVYAHCEMVLDTLAPAVVGVKLQLACFERLAAPGRAVLDDVCRRARELGLLVVADGKRGDIDVSAAAYAQSLYGGFETETGHVGGLAADAATIAPYMGRDSLVPFVDTARESGSGVFVLVRTSNPGAADFQDKRLNDAGALWEHVAEVVSGFGGGSSAIGDVGAVIGATAPTQLERAREMLPRAPFLLPGVGAQGGRVEDLRPAFEPGPGGGLVTVSRALVSDVRGVREPAAAALSAAEVLRERVWALRP